MAQTSVRACVYAKWIASCDRVVPQVSVGARSEDSAVCSGRCDRSDGVEFGACDGSMDHGEEKVREKEMVQV